MSEAQQFEVNCNKTNAFTPTGHLKFLLTDVWVSSGALAKRILTPVFMHIELGLCTERLQSAGTDDHIIHVLSAVHSFNYQINFSIDYK